MTVAGAGPESTLPRVRWIGLMMALRFAPGMRAGCQGFFPYGLAAHTPAAASCGVEDGGIDDGVKGGGRFASAYANLNPVISPGRSPRCGWRPLLPSFRSHPDGSSEFKVGLTATSENFPSIPFPQTLHARTSRAYQLPLLCESYSTLSMGGRLHGGIQGNHGSGWRTSRGRD